MKRYLLSGLLIGSLSLAAVGQSFTGSVKYSFKIENLPPGVDPAMMDQFIPSGMTTYAKNGKTATIMDGGMMSKSVASEKGDTAYLVIDKAERIFTTTKETSDKALKDAKAEKPVVTKTKQTETIAGYPCTLYTVTTKAAGQEVKQNVWATDKLKLPRSQYETSSMIPKDVPGTPMRVTMNQQGMSIIIEAKEVSTAVPSDDVFQLPAYHHEPFSQEAMSRAMMGR